MQTIPSVKKPTSSSVQAWSICFVASLFFFYEFIQMNILSTLGPVLMQRFNIDATHLGWLSASYFYANIIFLLPAGILLDRFSTRKIILVSLAICIAGTFAFALSPTFHWAIVARFFTGIGSAFCFLSCIRLASRWFSPHRMALVSGFIVTMAMLGGSVAQAPAAILNLHVGWQNTLYIDGLVGVVIWLLILGIVRDHPEGDHKTIAPEFFKDWSGFWRSFRSSYLSLQNWLCGLYTCFVNLPIFLLGGLYGTLYLLQIHHLSRTDASLITSSIFIGTIIGSPIAGLLSDFFSRRRMPMIVGVILSLAIILIIMYVPNLHFTALLVLFFLLGLVTSTQIISYPTVAESNPHSLTAMSVSVVSLSVISGGAIFQPFFGWLMDSTGAHQVINGITVYSEKSYHLGFMIMPIAFIAALVAALLLRETFCRALKKQEQ